MTSTVFWQTPINRFIQLYAHLWMMVCCGVAFMLIFSDVSVVRNTVKLGDILSMQTRSISQDFDAREVTSGRHLIADRPLEKEGGLFKHPGNFHIADDLSVIRTQEHAQLIDLRTAAEVHFTSVLVKNLTEKFKEWIPLFNLLVRLSNSPASPAVACLHIYTDGTLNRFSCLPENHDSKAFLS